MNLLKSKTYCSLLKSTVADNRALMSAFDGKTVMIAGASGMIGSFIAAILICANKEGISECRVIALGRNEDRLKSRFSEYADIKDFVILPCDVTEGITVTEDVDFIIHGASNADPVSFSKYPADTLLANIMGTYNLLQFCRKKGVSRFEFISSGEFYGSSEGIKEGFKESDIGKLDFSSSRICYPEGKRSAEALCKCYGAQYGIDTVAVRPCHVFGPTMTDTDSRAVSQFFRNACEGKDILLNSPGNVLRSQCYVADAAIGILTALIFGKKGEAYNISDPAFKMTIRQFAEAVAKAAETNVVFGNPQDSRTFEPVPNKMQVLDSSKLASLGWKIRSSDKIKETLEILNEV